MSNHITEPVDKDTASQDGVTLNEAALRMLPDDLMLAFAVACAESVEDGFARDFDGDTRVVEANALLRSVLDDPTIASSREFATTAVNLLLDRVALSHPSAGTTFAAINAVNKVYGNAYLPVSKLSVDTWAMAAAVCSSLDVDLNRIDGDQLAFQHGLYRDLLATAQAR